MRRQASGTRMPTVISSPSLSSMKGMGFLKGTVSELRRYADKDQAAAADALKAAGVQLKPVGAELAKNAAETGKPIMGALKASLANPEKIIDLDQWRRELGAKLNAAIPAAKAAGGGAESTRNNASGGAASGQIAAAVSQVTLRDISDRMSKIGGFIGGSGGPRGQKAQEETARNTKALISGTVTTHALMCQQIALTAPPGTFVAT